MVAGAKRMQVKFLELSQDISITHGIDQAVVDTVLEAYSAAVKRALAEDMIVEALRDVRLQLEEYYDQRNSRKAVRIVVNDELDRIRSSRHPRNEIEEEDERATEKLTRLLYPK